MVSVRGCAVEVNVDGDYKSCSGAVMLPLIGSLRRIDPTVVPLHRNRFQTLPGLLFSATRLARSGTRHSTTD